jgi:hypothetical protein
MFASHRNRCRDYFLCDDPSSSAAEALRAFALFPSWTKDCVYASQLKQHVRGDYVDALVRSIGFHPIELFSGRLAYLERLPRVLAKYKKRVPQPAWHSDFVSVLTLACDMLSLTSPFDKLVDFGVYAVCVLAYAYRFVCHSSIEEWLSLAGDIFVCDETQRRYVCVMDCKIQWFTPSKRARDHADEPTRKRTRL